MNLDVFSILGLHGSRLLMNRAYLDPGSGSFILQLVLASLLGLGFVIKTYWNRLVRFFKRGENDPLELEDD